MALVLGIAALVALVVGVGIVLVLGTRQAREEQEPASHPGDYVAPVSSGGGYRFRQPDETPEQFHARVARDGEAAAASATTEAGKKV